MLREALEDGAVYIERGLREVNIPRHEPDRTVGSVAGSNVSAEVRRFFLGHWMTRGVIRVAHPVLVGLQDVTEPECDHHGEHTPIGRRFNELVQLLEVEGTWRVEVPVFPEGEATLRFRHVPLGERVQLDDVVPCDWRLVRYSVRSSSVAFADADQTVSPSHKKGVPSAFSIVRSFPDIWRWPCSRIGLEPRYDATVNVPTSLSPSSSVSLSVAHSPGLGGEN